MCVCVCGNVTCNHHPITACLKLRPVITAAAYRHTQLLNYTHTVVLDVCVSMRLVSVIRLDLHS